MKENTLICTGLPGELHIVAPLFILVCPADGGPVAKKAKVQHGQLPAAVVLDIEGTVAPISFVTQTLFPYARSRVAVHLSATYDTPETQEDIDLLRRLVSGTFRLCTQHAAGNTPTIACLCCLRGS